MNNKFIIDDLIQKNIKINISWLELANNLFLGILIYLFYSNVEFNIFIKFIKYYILFLLIRYFISLLTPITNVETNKKYFQINGHIGVFLIILLLCIETNTFELSNNNSLTLFLLFLYSLIIIITKNGYTYDIITSILLIHYMFHSKIINSIIN